MNLEKDIKKPEDLENKNKPEIVVSRVLDDGTIIELIFDKFFKKTSLLFYKDGKIEERNSCLKLEGKEFKPYPTNKLITTKTVLLPTKAEEYSSDNELLSEIQAFIHKFLDISPFFEKLATYYVLFSWVYDKFNELPYLRLLGDWATGKSRGLTTIGSICYKPMLTSGATTVSPIFRIIDIFKGTLVIDEADLKHSDTNSEIIKIFNSGYERGKPVLRTKENKRNFDIEPFEVFCPKILGTRMRFQDKALESRCLVGEMEKKRIREDIPLNLTDEFWDGAQKLRNKLLMWRFRNYSQIELKTDLIDRSLDPRLNQVIIPLASIIKDEGLLEELKQFIKEYNKQLVSDRGMEVEAEILETINKLMSEDLILEPTIKEITNKYNEGYSEKEQLTARKIGYRVREKLNLKATKTRDGYRIKNDQFDRLQNLNNKYGLPEIVTKKQ